MERPVDYTQEDKSGPHTSPRYLQTSPSRSAWGVLSGAHPKLLMTSYQGRFYAPGCTPPELRERWDVCEDLAQQLAVKSRESKDGKRAHMTETQMLDQYLPRLIATNWTSEAEARWVMRRVAALLNWPVPESAVAQA